MALWNMLLSLDGQRSSYREAPSCGTCMFQSGSVRTQFQKSAFPTSEKALTPLHGWCKNKQNNNNKKKLQPLSTAVENDLVFFQMCNVQQTLTGGYKQRVHLLMFLFFTRRSADIIFGTNCSRPPLDSSKI